MRWTKPKLIAAGLVCAMATGVSVAYQQTKISPAPRVEMVDASAPAGIRAIERRIQGSMVFIDPVTGEMRAPEAGEHAQLAGASGAARVAAVLEPQAIAGPNETHAIAPETMRMEFLAVERSADGTLSYRCQNPAHKHVKGKNHAR